MNDHVEAARNPEIDDELGDELANDLANDRAKRLAACLDAIRRMRRVVVAFSAGVDSTLLLALAELDQEIGRSLSPAERQLLQRLAASLEHYDPEEIRAAIRHIVRSRAQGPADAWPGDLRRRLRRRLEGR